MERDNRVSTTFIDRAQLDPGTRAVFVPRPILPSAAGAVVLYYRLTEVMWSRVAGARRSRTTQNEKSYSNRVHSGCRGI